MIAVVLAATGGTVALPSLAAAHFARPFLCSIKQPFNSPGAMTVDSSDHLWVGESLPGGGGGSPGPGRLYEFEPAYSSCAGFKTSLGIEGLDVPENLAFNSSTGDFYVTGEIRGSGSSGAYVEVFDGTGKLVERWAPQFAEASVAVDNGTGPADPSAGSVYVGHWEDTLGPLGDGQQPGIGRFDAVGKPISFSGSGGGPSGSRCAKAVEGNQIFGSPTECFRPEGLAVDLEGKIYASNGGKDAGTLDAVDEFSPSGAFEREFTGKGTPGMGKGQVGNGGLGGSLKGVAVDTVAHHVLVGVDAEGSENENEGAVDEFDAKTGKFLDQITESAPGSRLRAPRRMSVDSHGDLYVLDSTNSGELEQEHAVDVYGPGHFLPTLTIDEATARKPTSAEVSGTVNPEGFPLTECNFEYVTEASFRDTGFSDLSSGGKAACSPQAASLPPNSVSRVHANLAGLVSGSTYRYRLVAASFGALGGTGESSALAVTAQHAPRIESTSASNLSSEFADLHAQIDPLGANTQYHFEYVDQAGYESTAEDPYRSGSNVPSAPVSIGSGGPTGDAVSSVVQQIGGLSPGTTYHFRVVAENVIEGETQKTYSSDNAFTTTPLVVAGAPDERVYELMTPPNKAGSPDLFGSEPHFPPGLTEFPEFGNLDVGVQSESGEQYLFSSTAAFGSFPASEKNSYIFSRKAAGAGWTFSPLASPALGVQIIGESILFDPFNFSQVGILDESGSSGSEVGTVPRALIGPPGGPYTTLHTDAPRHAESSDISTSIVGASHRMDRVILEGEDHTMCAGAESQDPTSPVLCEWAGEVELVGGEPRPALTLVNIDKEGLLLNRCGAMLGQGSSLEGSAHNAVSEDGSRIFFTAPDPSLRNEGGCWNGGTVNTPQLYMRSHGETVQVSAAQAGVHDPTENHPVVYVGASADGAKVFFLTEAELTQDDSFHDAELYEYDTEHATLTRISAGEPGSPVLGQSSTGAHVWTVPAVSADGSTVYFTALGQLTTDAPTLGSKEVNLYRYDTSTGRTRYVTTVDEQDYVSDVASSWPNVGAGATAALQPEANWYATPNGMYLLFATGHELTDYQTIGDCPLPDTEGNSNGHCDEVYRYDAVAADKHERSIVCVSCDPNGALPTSNALFERSAPHGLGSGPVPAMSNDGAYVFFDTTDALVPQDGNGTLDTYEWHEGRVSLISSGQDSAPSFFLGEGSYVNQEGTLIEGGNVFFGTHARMVAQDTDTNGDLYDARIGGSPPPSEGGTGICEGDACQNLPPTPIDATPVSLTFSGPGNVTSEVKAEGKPKKKGKAKRRSKAKKHKVKGGKKARRSARRGGGVKRTGRSGR